MNSTIVVPTCSACGELILGPHCEDREGRSCYRCRMHQLDGRASILATQYDSALAHAASDPGEPVSGPMAARMCALLVAIWCAAVLGIAWIVARWIAS
jgi:hypothetical protein